MDNLASFLSFTLFGKMFHLKAVRGERGSALYQMYRSARAFKFKLQ